MHTTQPLPTLRHPLAALRRYRIYRSSDSPRYLCICSARDPRHALQIARRMFKLSRTARACLETPAAP